MSPCEKKSSTSERLIIMSSLLVEGGRRLSGKITVEGNKNAALPLLAACVLTSEECVLTNMPRIGDVAVMASLLKDIGADDDHERQHIPAEFLDAEEARDQDSRGEIRGADHRLIKQRESHAQRRER